MSNMQGPTLSEEQVGALKFCRLITQTTTRLYLCRQKHCRFFYQENIWVGTQGRYVGTSAVASVTAIRVATVDITAKKRQQHRQPQLSHTT